MASGDNAVMTKVHAIQLRQNSANIEKIMSPDRVVVFLYQKFVLTTEDKEDVMSERTRHKKNRKLLEIIETKPDSSFNKFVDALRDSSQPHVANLVTAPPPATTPVQVSPSDRRPQQVSSMDTQDDRGMPAADTEGRPLRNTVYLPQLTPEWKIIPPYSLHADVTPTMPEKFQQLQSQLDKEIYQTHKARKGKVCIIAVPRFEVEWLEPLHGYDHDEKKLTRLFSSLGFEVRIPRVGPRSLSMIEIRSALHAFAQAFTAEDQVAALCVLSHGVEGVVYGSDGKTLNITEILYSLDNDNCPLMMGKPKIAVIHSCQGGNSDRGTGWVASADSCGGTLPSVSDMIICYPTMPGFASFVSPESGSLYINNFVEVLSRDSGTEEVLHLLTKLNDAIKCQEVKGLPYKQMSCSLNCLTKKFYLLPCCDQQDWQ